METSNSIGKISAAIVEASKEIKSLVGFDSNNPYYNSQYTSLGKIIDQTKPILAKHDLAVIQFPISEGITEGITVGVETILLHSSGEMFREKVSVMLPDSKNAIQEAGKNITYLRRYSMASILGLYADEDNDGNSNQDSKKEPAQPKPRKQPEPEKNGLQPREEATRPYNPKQLKEALKKMTKFITAPASQKQVEFLAAMLSQETIGDDERHRLQKYLFGQESLTKVDKTLVAAALKWLDPVHDGSNYTVSELATTELANVLEEINKE